MPEENMDEYFLIQNIVHSFFRLVDDGQAAETARLFTSDARIIYGPGTLNPGVVEGEAILAAMTARQAQTHVTTRHVTSNFSLQRNSENEINARSLLTLFRSETPSRPPIIYAVADISDTFVKMNGEWLFRERRIEPAFAEQLGI